MIDYALENFYISGQVAFGAILSPSLIFILVYKGALYEK